MLGLRDIKYGSFHCVMMHCMIPASAKASTLITPLVIPAQIHSSCLATVLPSNMPVTHWWPLMQFYCPPCRGQGNHQESDAAVSLF